MQTTTLVQLRQEHLREIGTIAAKANYNDQCWSYIFPEKETRFEEQKWFWERYIQINVINNPKSSWVAIKQNRVVGFITMIRPSDPQENFWAELRVGLGKLPFITRWRTLKRMIETNKLHEKITSKIRNGSNYIANLCVDPDEQRHGIGTILMNQCLQQCDNGVYLTTSNPRNIDYYQRFGFEMVDETDDGLEPKFYLMSKGATLKENDSEQHKYCCCFPAHYMTL